MHNRIMVEVIATDEFAAWYKDLDQADAEEVYIKVELLRAKGVALGSPHSSAIKGCEVAMRELRIQSRGRPLRVFYAFDRKRQAVLLIGGDKTGDDRFYGKYVNRAQKIWFAYLEEAGKE